MDWIAHNLQVIIAIAGAVAWWLTQRKRDESTGDSESSGKTFGDPELAERTRRIREEIQRKIDQRNRGLARRTAVPPPSAAPRPTDEEGLPGFPPLLRELMEAQAPVPPVIPAAPARADPGRAAAQRQAEILEQQATMAEQLRMAKEMKEAALRRRQFEQTVADRESAGVTALRGALEEDLRSPESLRRAFLLREVLGPPVALR
ncbi:MAG TPA: hypothetical protein VL200_03915 [Lacunisphaera sp.]|jgi:hypothetical protein|nr:hypothetical protein [Lacunisphaera sp.]